MLGGSHLENSGKAVDFYSKLDGKPMRAFFCFVLTMTHDTGHAGS